MKFYKIKQKTRLNSYIAIDTEKHNQTTTFFQKDFFKLLNNSVLEKTMENQRNHVNIDLIDFSNRAENLVMMPSFYSFKKFRENLIVVNCKKTSLKWDKYIYVGFSILELSNILMYQFHYDFMKSKCGNRAQLVFTDTDSLTYEVETTGFYQDMALRLDRFDASDYPALACSIALKTKKL